MSQPDPNASPKIGFSSAIGCALVAIGLLILVPSGLCTAIILPSWIRGQQSIIPAQTEDLITLGIVVAVGLVLTFAGWKLWRRG